jgi:hypothetical protein
MTRLKKLQGMSWSFFSIISHFLGKPKKTGDKRSKLLKTESQWSIILQNLVEMDQSSGLIGGADQPFISKVIIY